MNNELNVKATFKIAFPLMISSLSTMLMITIDRIMLANYNIMVMNAVAVVGLLLFSFEHGFSSMSGISEVMAGHFNGAMDYKKTPSSTWQMIFLGIASAFVLIPSGIFLGPYVIPDIFLDSSLGFFRILMSSLFLSVLFSAVAGFFIGTKQTKIVAIASFSSNCLNILLNFLLIFGVEGWINPMGATGAAIGTSFSLLVQFMIVFILFLSKRQDDKYHTRNCRFDLKMMLGTLNIGVPNSVGYMVHILSGYVIMLIIVDTSIELVTVQNICINILLFIYSVNDGICKAVISLASNVLGSKRYKKIINVISSGLIIQFFSFLILSSIILFYRDGIINLYTDNFALYPLLYTGIIWVLFFYLIDGSVWVLGNVLIAGGDTKFTTISDIIVVWSIRVLPLYFIDKAGLGLSTIWTMYVTSSLILICIFVYRIFRGNWKHNVA